MNLKALKRFLNTRIENVFEALEMKYEILGDNIYSTCPAHESSDNPRAFSFCKKRGIWKCWTRECQNEHKNDIFGLIKGSLANINGSDVSFSEVMLWIRDNFNVETDIEEEQAELEEFSELDQLLYHLKDDVVFPESKILETPIVSTIPSKYFISRGFSKKTLEYFEIGDCYDKNSPHYERAIIPIHNDIGHRIGYTCRAIKEYKIPKFMIYPKGFNKKFYFYNLHRALAHIQSSNALFIVEGQGDVWKLYESGVYNVVGMFGKTLSKEQQKRLQQLPLTHIIILTDPDQAGRESKVQLQRQLGRFYRLSFPQLSHKDIGDMSIKQIQQDILSQIRG